MQPRGRVWIRVCTNVQHQCDLIPLPRPCPSKHAALKLKTEHKVTKMDTPTLPLDTDDRSDPNSINIAVPVVLVGIILILLVALALSALLFLKKRRKLCFKERFDDVKPFLRTDKQLESRASKAGWLYQNKNQRSALKKKKNKKSKVKYQSLGKTPKFPKSDPFANKFLENPLVTEDDFDVDWTNPAFDTAQAQVRDAAITIQCWYRMIRWVSCSFCNRNLICF